jgi:hypothetical protein
MTFADKLASQLDAYKQAQKVKAWSLATGLVASIYAIGIASMARPIFHRVPDLESVVVAFWAGGAIYGAVSLITIGVINDPSARQRRILEIGLWAGNLVVCGNTAVFPIVLPLALIPVIGGAIVLSRRSTIVGWMYVSLPVITIGLMALNWAVGSPIKFDLLG